jgi:hypothetical protein
LFAAGGLWIDASPRTKFQLKTISQPSIYTVSEVSLAEELGVPRKVVRGIRLQTLKKGAGYILRSRQVFLSPESASQISKKSPAAARPLKEPLTRPERPQVNRSRRFRQRPPPTHSVQIAAPPPRFPPPKKWTSTAFSEAAGISSQKDPPPQTTRSKSS